MAYNTNREGKMAVREASMDMVDGDEMIVCPYDKVHIIRAKRFPYHLIKCRNNYRGHVFVTCPFNARHRIPRPEQRHHIANCSDKVLIELDHEYNTKQTPDDEKYQGNISVPKYYKDAEIADSGENWDDDNDGGGGLQSYSGLHYQNGMTNEVPQSYHVINQHRGSSQYDRTAEQPLSLRQPRSQPTAMLQPQNAVQHSIQPDYQSQMTDDSSQERVVQQQQAPQPLVTAHAMTAHASPTSQQQTHTPKHTSVSQEVQPNHQSTAALQAASWAKVAGIGRGMTSSLSNTDYPPLGRGVGRGIVRPPPGFGRGQVVQRGPPIAANIYSNGQ